MLKKRLGMLGLVFVLTGTSVFGNCCTTGVVYAEEVMDESKNRAAIMGALEFLNLCNSADFINITTSGTQAAEMMAVISEVTQGLEKDYERAEAIYNWVADNITYESNPYVDISAEPYDVFTNKLAVCGGFSNLVKEMLNLAGIPAAAVVGYLYGYLPHQWNMVYADGQWVYADATGKGYFNEVNMPSTHDVKEIKDVTLDYDDLQLGYYYGLAVMSASSTKVEIPDSYKGYPITSISYTLFGYQSNVEELTINANITQMEESTLRSNTKMKYITVAEGNPSYASHQGALFTADYQSIIVYPYSSDATEFTLPKETRSFDYKEAFRAANLKNLYVEEGSSYFSSYDGAIYDSEKTVLLSVPSGKTSLCVYENASIDDSAFANVDKDKFTIIAKSGSPAEAYAKENEIAFQEPSTDNKDVEEKLLGHSLSLEGNIGVNFHMQLGQEVINNAEAYMNFTINGENMKVYMKDAVQKTLNGTKCYVFKCCVPVKDMGTEITAQIVLDEEHKGSVYTYTVKDYAKYILDGNGEYPEKAIALVEAMSVFGDYATAYFGNGKLDATSEMEKVTSDALQIYQATILEGKDDIYQGSSLLLKSNTIIRHYFTEEVEGSIKKGNLYYLDSEGIPAHKLGDELVTTVGDITIKYSPLSYAYNVLSRDGYDESLTSLIRAMYLYYQAAQDYFGLDEDETEIIN